MRAIFPEIGLQSHLPMDVNPSAPLAEGLICHFPLNEGNGPIIYSTNGLRGRICGESPILDYAAAIQDVWKPGRTGWAISGNGTVYGWGIPTAPALSLDYHQVMRHNQQMSAAIWIKPRTITGNYRTLFAKCPNNTPAQYQMSLHTTDGSLLFYNGVAVYTSTYIPPVGQWTFIAGTWGNGTVRMYANGRLVNEQAIGEASVGIGPVTIAWTGRSSNEVFDGMLEHFYLYRRILLPGEINELYANVWAPEKATNKRHWNMTGVASPPIGFSDAEACYDEPEQYFPRATYLGV